MSRIFYTMIEAYEAHGLTVQTGLSPFHFPGFSWRDLPFTYFYRDGQKICEGGGIALVEIVFLESLFLKFQPRNIFIIGNAFGWSTIALALLNPEAKVVAIDSCPTQAEEVGLQLTNTIASDLGLNAQAVKGQSPENVQHVFEEHFDATIDVTFIDGGHNNEQLALDIAATHTISSETFVCLMHDVINCDMIDSFSEFAKSSPEITGELLFRTPSGMGICYSKSLKPDIGPIVRMFTESQERLDDLYGQYEMVKPEVK